MEPILRTVNALISALFFVCYTYQFLYIPLVLLKKRTLSPIPPRPTATRYSSPPGTRRPSSPGCWTLWPPRPTTCPW